MSYDSKKKSGNKKDEIGFWDRLIYRKGSVAEPWQTVQEILAEKEVQEEIKKVERAFKAIDSKIIIKS